MTFDRKKYMKNYFKDYRLENKEKLRIYRREWQRNKRYMMKQKLFEILGGKKCVKCGFTDERALQFDHINGGGYSERKSYLSNYTGMILLYYRDPNIKNKLQVLCANCNWIKRHENKE